MLRRLPDCQKSIFHAALDYCTGIFGDQTLVLPADLPCASMRPTVRNGVAPAANGDKPMLSGAKTVTKTVILLAAIMLVVAGSFIWSRSGSTEQQAVQKAKPAEASA